MIKNGITMLSLLFCISRLLLRLLLAVLKIHNSNKVRGNPFYGTYSVCSVRSQNQSQNIIWYQGKSLCTNKLHLYLQNFKIFLIFPLIWDRSFFFPSFFFFVKYFENVVHLVLTNYYALDCAPYQLAIQYFLTAYNVMIDQMRHMGLVAHKKQCVKLTHQIATWLHNKFCTPLKNY